MGDALYIPLIVLLGAPWLAAILLMGFAETLPIQEHYACSACGTAYVGKSHRSTTVKIATAVVAVTVVGFVTFLAVATLLIWLDAR